MLVNVLLALPCRNMSHNYLLYKHDILQISLPNKAMYVISLFPTGSSAKSSIVRFTGLQYKSPTT